MTNNYRYNTGGRNYGYGKQINFAVKNALKDKYGEGKYATRAAHEARFNHFTQFLKCEDIKDLKKIGEPTIQKFGQTLINAIDNQRMSTSYAQNLLSSVNVVMSHVRGNNGLTISPAKTVGQRSHIRTTAPLSINRTLVDGTVQSLSPMAKVTVMLAREFGLRFKETALLNLNRALNEVTTLGTFNIQDGTKGGRTAPRWVQVSPSQLNTLKQAKQCVGVYKNLIGKVGSFKQWQNSFAAEYRNSGAHNALGKFHDLRAAYACERYQQLTGHPAPVVAGVRIAEYQADQNARAVLAIELGHNRIDVLNSYIGSAS